MEVLLKEIRESQKTELSTQIQWVKFGATALMSIPLAANKVNHVEEALILPTKLTYLVEKCLNIDNQIAVKDHFNFPVCFLVSQKQFAELVVRTENLYY